MNSEERTNQDNKRLAYEKAIEGYQFQVGRYNVWMNYYAIFVGAFFVALYSVWPEGKTEKAAFFLPLAISALGWAASIGWYGALIGYTTWNNHWMKRVHILERELGSDFPSVYGFMPEASNGRFVKGFVSTQKVTQWFLYMVILAWNVMIACLWCGRMSDTVCSEYAGVLVGVVTVVVSAVILALFHYCGCCLYSSKICGGEEKR